MPIGAPVARGDLKLGDLIITKRQLTGHGFMGGIIHGVISSGSFLAGNVQTANYVHAQIVCKDGPIQIAESFGKGLQIEEPYSPGTVFRLRREGGRLTSNFARMCAERAAEVAVELNGRQQANDTFAKYSIGKAFVSLFTTEGVNEGVKTRLQSIDEGTSHDKLFCSEFVIICYQVAVRRLVMAGFAPQGRLLPFNLDAKAMEPAYLASYMRRNPDQWDEVGDFPGGHD